MVGGAAGSTGVLCAATSEEVAARLARRDAQTAGPQPLTVTSAPLILYLFCSLPCTVCLLCTLAGPSISGLITAAEERLD